MSAWFARVGLPGGMSLVVRVTMMVPISCCWVIVIVRGRAVVVIRVIVPDVFVDVQRRRRGGRHNQTLSEKKCDQAAHGSSVLRPARKLGRRAGSAVGSGWIGHGRVEISTRQRSGVRPSGLYRSTGLHGKEVAYGGARFTRSGDDSF